MDWIDDATFLIVIYFTVSLQKSLEINKIEYIFLISHPPQATSTRQPTGQDIVHDPKSKLDYCCRRRTVVALISKLLLNCYQSLHSRNVLITNLLATKSSCSKALATGTGSLDTTIAKPLESSLKSYDHRKWPRLQQNVITI